MDKLYQKIIPLAKKPPTKKESVVDLISQLEAHDQINLDINVKRENRVKKMRKKTRSWIEILKINPYWKQFTSVAMLITSLTTTGIYLFLFLTRYNDLPEQIPTLYNQGIKAWTYNNKEDLFIIPIVHLVISLILIRINLSIFKFDRRLVIILNNSMTLFNVIFLYEIFQIYTMLLVY